MRVTIKSDDLQTKAVSWLCVEPMLLAVRGKDLKTKQEMYNKLNERQKSLFLFYSFHNHTETKEQFYWFAAYHINELQSWHEIKQAVLLYNDSSMASLLDDIKAFIERRNQAGEETSVKELDEDQLYALYTEHADETIDRMNSWVRANQEHFFEI